jgi:hypothetical protein
LNHVVLSTIESNFRSVLQLDPIPNGFEITYNYTIMAGIFKEKFGDGGGIQTHDGGFADLGAIGQGRTDMP